MHTQKKIFTQPNASGIAILGLLTAIRLILGSSLFTFYLIPNKIQFSFAFIATFLIAMWFGPFWAGFIGGFADIFLTLISGQIYFPGFTLSAIITGFVFGIFFFNRQPTLKTIIISQLIVVIFVNLFLNTLWVVILNHVPFDVIFISRFIKEIVTVLVQVFIMDLIVKNKTIISLGKRLRK
ncbi:folate family ECF transporter S component [Nicoliella spurrieriana]|uniref:Folate family ECF transporter S component n=1 Tax=Nicoliella spurrieriana TaxID=2925830 RepID=A0A976X5D9_9LACO|nr:folate family ECF transporter S component [Nicoliella spurrieriana]UQS86596.1 folate family ECF transporter S component [Nicoliella spurrieriana]